MKTSFAFLEGIQFECAREMLCTRCHCPLDRHQPDEARPNRLLGTCCDCGAWYLIDVRSREMFALVDVWSRGREQRG
jgi:hypothetical protein